MPFGIQLVYDLLINLHSNTHHLLATVAMVTRQRIQDRFSIFEILLNIKIFCWKQLVNIILYVKTMI